MSSRIHVFMGACVHVLVCEYAARLSRQAAVLARPAFFHDWEDGADRVPTKSCHWPFLRRAGPHGSGAWMKPPAAKGAN